jgi:hypothetical protein
MSQTFAVPMHSVLAVHAFDASMRASFAASNTAGASFPHAANSVQVVIELRTNAKFRMYFPSPEYFSQALFTLTH